MSDDRDRAPAASRDATATPSGLRERVRRAQGAMHANPALALVSKVVVGLVGGAVLVTGVVMIVTPGPAFVLVPLGLAILASEFSWARRALEKAKEQAVRAKERAAAQDPGVRRRNLALGVGGTVLVVAAVVGYVAAYDWPGFAVHGWDWVQSKTGFVPDLPGM